MQIFSKNHSSYPRVGDTPELQCLRKAYNSLDKGRMTATEVARILDDTVAKIVTEQVNSGCDIITDGMVRTYDPLSYLAGKIDGFEITGLLRFFDTNYLYRQPKVTGAFTADKSLIVEDYKFSARLAEEKASAVMFGPYSLLRLSNIDMDFETRLEELINIYMVELVALKAEGACLVQLDEPAILAQPEDFDLFKSLYDTISGHDEIPELMLAFYFGNITPHIEKLAELNVDSLMLDFTYSPGLSDSLKGFDKNIGLGIIDGRNTKLEKPERMAIIAESILEKVNSDRAYLSTSCGLEFLPRGRAYDKLKLAATTVAFIKGGE